MKHYGYTVYILYYIYVLVFVHGVYPYVSRRFLSRPLRASSRARVCVCVCVNVSACTCACVRLTTISGRLYDPQLLEDDQMVQLSTPAAVLHSFEIPSHVFQFHPFRR